MIHCEICEVYQYTSTPDGYGGQTPTTPELQTAAPIYFTINPVSGNDIRISLRLDTEYTFDIFCNYTSGFTWQRNMFISSRFGNIDITNIVETGRKRGFRLEGRLIAGVTSGGSGTPTYQGLYTIYYPATYGETTVNIPQLAGANILLGFRDGIGKKVVAPVPELNQLGVDSTGDVTLVPGDIFGDELLTFLYQVTA